MTEIALVGATSVWDSTGVGDNVSGTVSRNEEPTMWKVGLPGLENQVSTFVIC